MAFALYPWKNKPYSHHYHLTNLIGTNTHRPCQWPTVIRVEIWIPPIMERRKIVACWRTRRQGGDSEMSAPVPSRSYLGHPENSRADMIGLRLLCQGLLIVSIFKNSDALLSLVKNCLEGLTFITELFTEPFLGLVVGLPFHPCGIIFGQGVGDLQETVLYLQVCYRVQAASWNQWERNIAKVRFSTFNYKTGHIGHPTVKTGQI